MLPLLDADSPKRVEALDLLEIGGDGGSLSLNRLRLLADVVSMVKTESSSKGDCFCESYESWLPVSDCAGEKSLMPQKLSQSVM